MIDRATIRRLTESVGSDNDIRDLLADHKRLTEDHERLSRENERLQKALIERRPMTEADPTGGISDDERQARRKSAIIP